MNNLYCSTFWCEFCEDGYCENEGKVRIVDGFCESNRIKSEEVEQDED